MEKNIKLKIIKKNFKSKKKYFCIEEYKDFYKEFEYNITYFSLNSLLLYILKEYKLLIIITIILIIYLKRYY